MKDAQKRIVAAIIIITLLLNVAPIDYFDVYAAETWEIDNKTNDVIIYSSAIKGTDLISIFQTLVYDQSNEFKYAYDIPENRDTNWQNYGIEVNPNDEYSFEFGTKDTVDIFAAPDIDWDRGDGTKLTIKKAYTIETEPKDMRQPAIVNVLSDKNIGIFNTESEFDVALKSMITASWSNSEGSGSVNSQNINVSLALTNEKENEFGETVKYYSVTVTVSEGENWLATEQATVFEDVYWTVNQYTISFNTDGGTEILPIKQDYGTEIAPPDVPTKDGYTFIGWDRELPATMPAENIIIAANWAVATKNVSFDPNEGVWLDETRGIKTEKLDFDYNLDEYIAPKRSGYDFVGWEKQESAIPGADESYKAIWNIGKTVTFKDGDTVFNYNYAVGETITPPTLAEKVGYRFSGWDLVEQNGVGDGKTDSVAIMGNESVTYVAIWVAKRYTVTFLYENGDLFESVDYDYGCKIIAPSSSAKEGHTFVGWDLNIDGNFDGIADAVSPTMGAENLEYREIFKINQYTITFDTNGGSEIAPITQNYGTAVIPPAHPMKVGCEFDGWDINIPQTMPAINLTITAIWKTNSYTITFDTAGGTAIDPIIDKYGETVSVPSVPSKVGYTFVGWDKEIPETMPAENIILKAVWTVNRYTISFDTDGGSPIDPITQAYGMEITKPNDPAKDGYKFIGWDKEIPTTMPAEDITITAKWDVAIKTVSFDPNGGAWGDDSTEVKTVQLSTKENVADYQAPIRSGYDFGGWKKQESAVFGADESYVAIWNAGKTVTFKDGDSLYEQNYAVGESVDVPQLSEKVGHTFVGWDLVDLNGVGNGFKDQVISVMGSESLTYVAIWETNEYTVCFYNENDELIEAITEKYGASFGISITPTKTGHTFVGWDLKNDGKYDAIADAVSPTMGAENLEYREIFRINQYTITFDTNGGSAIEPITLNYGATITPPAHPTKVGCEFDGWDIIIPQTMPAKDYTITARWKTNSYTITFDTDGGSEIAPIVYKYGEVVSVSSLPSKIGYTFAGWDKDIPTTMPAESITIKAKWIVNGYTITFDTEGGSQIAPITQSYGTEISKPDNPEKEGYVFVGWDKEIPSTMPAENLTITARWEEAVKIISFDPNGGVWADNTNEIKTEKFNLDYNAEKYIAPTKRGYDFGGWKKKDTVASGTDETYEAVWILGKAVTFKDGDVVYEGNYAFGETVTAPILAEKVGHTFVGWDLVGANGVGNGFKDQVISVMGNESLVYVAIWKANEYTVYFYNENDDLIEAITAKYGAPFGISITPTKTGHTFVGWDLKKDGKYDAIADAVSPTMGAENLEYRELFAIGQYTITFESAGGSAVAPITQSYGTDVVVPADPTKDGYVFVGWDQGVPLTMPALNITLTARWEKAKYSISWDMNADGVIDDFDIVTTVEHGDIPELPEAEVPVKESTAEHTYVFTNSWLPAIKPADGDATYTAQYDAVLRKYTVKFLNYDGSTLQTSDVEYGSTPVYGGSTPVKTDDKQYDYTFAGWTPNVEAVTEDAAYTATFAESIKKYTVVWKNWDGSVLETDYAVEHGDFPKYNGKTPTKPATEAVNYIFEGWTPQISGVTGDVTYTATFTEKVKTYSINWIAEDGSIIDVTVVEYGEIPAYAAPMKPSTAEYSYTFAGWNPAPVAVTEDATYTASYTVTKNKYTVTWNVDGVKTSESYEYGVLPAFKGSTDKAADGCTVYSFTGWNKKISEVVGNVEYTATYSTATVHTSTEITYSDITKTTHDVNFACCNAIRIDNTAHNYVDKNCICGEKKTVTIVIMNGDSVWATIESEDDTEVSVSDMPVPTPTPGYVFSGWYTEDGVRVESETDLTDDMVLHAGYFSGDVDGDGTIEKEDVDKLTRYIVGQNVATVEDEKAFDINGDGDVTVVDSILLLLHISGKRPMTP